MLHALKWEFFKIIHRYGYYALALIGLVLITFMIPDGKLVIAISVGLVCLGVCLMFLPFNNLMLLFKEPGFTLERQRRRSGYELLIAKLCINIVLAAFMQIVFQTANYAMQRFETLEQAYFFYDANKPIGHIIFEMSIFYPIVFLCIYYWIGKAAKLSHGILSGILCLLVCGTVSTLEINIWGIILFESALSLLLIILLGKWIDRTKEAYC